jgi:hypothetical protein
MSQTLARVLHPNGRILIGTHEDDEMPKTKSGSGKKHGDPMEPLIERTGERSSPGSGEEGDDTADLQPDDVERDDTAR